MKKKTTSPLLEQRGHSSGFKHQADFPDFFSKERSRVRFMDREEILNSVILLWKEDLKQRVHAKEEEDGKLVSPTMDYGKRKGN